MIRDPLLPVHREELQQLVSESLVLVARIILNAISMATVIGAWYLVSLLLDGTGASQDRTVSVLVAIGSYTFLVIAGIIMLWDVATVFLNRWKLFRTK